MFSGSSNNPRWDFLDTRAIYTYVACSFSLKPTPLVAFIEEAVTSKTTDSSPPRPMKALVQRAIPQPQKTNSLGWQNVSINSVKTENQILCFSFFWRIDRVMKA